MYETITFLEQGDVATVRLVRPRINVRQIRELERVCDHLEDNSAARIVVFRGHSEGIDFSDFDPKEPLDIHGFNKWEKLVNRIERISKVTVAAIDGPAVGGGFQLALACDLRVCSDNAVFSLPEVHLGFLPGMATWRLAKYVGLGHAKRIVLLGEKVDAARALSLGIVDRVEADVDVALSGILAALAGTNAVAASLARRLLNESYGAEIEDAIGNFLAAQHRALNQSTFLETLKKERKAT